MTEQNQAALPNPGEDATKKGIIAWFTRNSVAANLLMIFLLLGGVYSITGIKKEMFPAFELNIITIQVPYPGAAPQEVEEGVLIRIEEAIEDIEGKKKVTARAREGLGTVSIEVEDGYDVQEVMDEVQQRVDGIPTFPDSIERPSIYQVKPREEIINVQLYGDLDEASLKRLGQKFKDEIALLPGITTVEMWGARDFEIAVELSTERMQEYDLSFDQVTNAMRASSLDLPSGSLKTAQGDILLRVNEQAYVGSEFENIVIKSQIDGTKVRIKDIGRVIDGFEERENRALFNGKNSIGINVFAVGEQDAIQISEVVNQYVADKKNELPESVDIDVWADRSFYLKGRLDMMLGNMWTGALLVFLVLALFLEVRVAFWVIVGLPICFMGTIFLMPMDMFGVSINVLSLFGFILVLGIVVDDAIIIGESSQSAIEKEGLSTESVIKGAQKVAMPATFGVLTTIAAFVPMLLVGGAMGVIWQSIAWVVILSLCFSLVESKLILPAHLAHLDGLSKFGSFFGRIGNFYRDYRFQSVIGANTLSRLFIRILVLIKIALLVGPRVAYKSYLNNRNGKDSNFVTDTPTLDRIIESITIAKIVGFILGYFICFILMPLHIAIWVGYQVSRIVLLTFTWLFANARNFVSRDKQYIRFFDAWAVQKGNKINANQWLRDIAEQKYSKVLDWLIVHRYVAVAAFLGIFLVSINLVKAGFVRTVSFPDLPSDFVQMSLTMAEGTSSIQTNKALDEIENALARLDKKLEREFGEPVVNHTFSWMQGETTGRVFAELTKSETRDENVLNSKVIVDRWRKETPLIPGVKSLKFNASIGGGGGADLSFRLESSNLNEISLAIADLEEHMATYEGVSDISNTSSGGKKEIKLALKPEARLLGLSLMDVARQVRYGFYGAEVQRIQRDREEIKVMVRYPKNERSSLGNLENLKIRLADGSLVPFSSVATMTMDQGYGQIERVDGKRAITVEATLDKTIAEPFKIVSQIQKEFLPELKRKYPSIGYQLEGASKEEAESFLSLFIGFLMAMLVIYGLLAIPLKSYWQPVIVMSVIPFGIIGAIIGHLLTGHDLSMLSMFGIIALSGVVVNDSLIMVDFVNRARAEGKSIIDSAIGAGVQRFRAILLTSLTTFMGLAPIIFFETSLQAKIVQPMAVSLGFGILFATMITLALVPCLYVIIDDIGKAVRRKFGAKEEVDPELDTLVKVEQTRINNLNNGGGSAGKDQGELPAS